MEIAREPSPALEYEPPVSARPVSVEHDAGVTRIIVAMTGFYGPMPKELGTLLGSLDIFSLVVVPVAVPIWLLAAVLIRWILRLPKPPRAVFEIGADVVRVTLVNSGLGGLTQYEFPRTAIVEARINRFERGFWLNVTGHMKNTILHNVPRKTLATLEAEMQSALSSFAAKGASENCSL
jgi:hypothetical protein